MHSAGVNADAHIHINRHDLSHQTERAKCLQRTENEKGESN